jgi:hypothetical protein
MFRRWNFDAIEADLALTQPDAPAPVAPQAAVFRGGGFRL